MRGVEHEAVNHRVREYMRKQAHRNGLKSFWSILKRGSYGIYHKVSVQHPGKYVAELIHCHNIREQDTTEQVGNGMHWTIGKRLRYRDLIAGSEQVISAVM